MRGFVLPIVLAALLSPFGGKAHRKTEDGNRHFELGEFAEALTDYTEAQVVAPESPRLHYDIGNVLYRQGDYEAAAEAFTRALVTAPGELAPSAAYNLGNSRFQQQEFQAAADAYRRSLETRPDDLEAKRNLELALRALEEQQQEQQQSDSSDQQEENEQQQSGEPDAQQQPEPSEDGEDDGQESQQREQPAAADEAPDGMTAEQAERLLDSLATEEQQNLERERQRKAAAARSKKREKDW